MGISARTSNVLATMSPYFGSEYKGVRFGFFLLRPPITILMTVTKSQDAPLVVVGGVTGKQGGSVVRFLVDSPKTYRIRALTRDATKPHAQRLAEQGIEVVSVNLTADNKAKIAEAYSGADVVFVSLKFVGVLCRRRTEGS